MKKSFQFIEPLESRIAPAVLVAGGNLLGGSGNPTTGETSTGGNTVTLIKVLHGQALVFFDPTSHEITGISVGKHTQIDITGNIYGDIVTNLLPSGRLTDSDGNAANGEDGGVLLPINIKGITTHKLGGEDGDIGRIIAGGSIKNVNVSGQLDGLYAGDGIFRDGPTAVVNTKGVDYNSVQTGVQSTFVLTQSAALPYISANISKVAVHTANQLEIFAGNGHTDPATGVGQAGGSISNVTITKTLTGEGAKPALSLHSGDGGDGSTGGAGGNITNFDDMGSIAYVRVQTGDGGAGGSDHGGAGGSLTASTVVTNSPRYDLFMGSGGEGATAGGAGGLITQLNFTNNVNGGKSLVTLGDFNGDGLQDVLLINTLTGEGTLSLGKVNTDTTAGFSIALQPKTNADGSAGVSPFIASVGAVPTSVAAADLNGDGILDFVVSYASTNNLGVFLGHGDGTFAASSIALASSPTRVALGDFAGTAAPDIAVLSSGSLTSTSGSANSQIFIAQNDGTGHFTTLANPTTISGFGTDLAAAQVDKVGTTDLFVGLDSGNVDTLLGTGTGFNLAATFNAFPTAVTNLDVGPTTNTTTTLLAFDVNIHGTSTTDTTVQSQVDVFTVGTSGTSPGDTTFQPAASDVSAAHFIKGTNAIGVVGSQALSIYTVQSNVYTSLSSVTSDGVLNDFTGIAGTDGFQIAAVGAATNRFFYTAGEPDGVTGLPAFKPINTPFEPRIISFVGGDGGHGGSNAGGLGGGVDSLTYTQTLGGGVLQAGGTYETHVTTGAGGDSDSAPGGKGGDLGHVSLSLAAGYQNDKQDDTTSTFLTTGHGGTGTVGGAGGAVTRVTAVSQFVQMDGNSAVEGAVTMQIVSGDGGVGTAGSGGAGGAITLGGVASLSGITYNDVSSVNPEAPALQVKGGNGGNGVSAGGAGGALTNVGAQNALFAGNQVLALNELSSAFIEAGNGGNASAGNGGAGGVITGLNVAVQNVPVLVTIDPTTGALTPSSIDGTATVISGSGGNGTGGVGGDAGSVTKSTVASLTGDVQAGYGVLIAGGNGGDGSLGGGKGGGVKTLAMNTASTNDAFAAVVLGGQGGAATESGPGGRGGTIKGITQSKDVNSTINTIQAGDGGTSASGQGGQGGSVKNVVTAGFIGLPSVTPSVDGFPGTDGVYLGAFDNVIASSTIDAIFATGANVPQGIFAGRGADGAANGSVFAVVARQIAAIAATVDANGTFAPAKAISNVSADLIGYDLNQNGLFDSTVAGGVSPATARPIDGFLLAGSFDQINISGNGAARTAGFEFVG